MGYLYFKSRVKTSDPDYRSVTCHTTVDVATRRQHIPITFAIWKWNKLGIKIQFWVR
jgi:hypothetical protein